MYCVWNEYENWVVYLGWIYILPDFTLQSESFVYNFKAYSGT